MKPSLSHEECLRLLDVAVGASPEELRRAFRRQTMLWHPDRFPPGSDLYAEAEERIKAINDAYAFLRSNPRVVPILLSPEEPPAKPMATRPMTWVLLAVALALGSWMVGKRNETRRENAARAAAAVAPRPPSGAEAPTAAPVERPTTVVHSHGFVIFAPPPQEVEKLSAEKAQACEQFLQNALLVRERVEQAAQKIPVFQSNDELIVFGAYSVERESAGSFGYLICFPPDAPQVLDAKKKVEEVVAIVLQSMKDYEAFLREKSKEPGSVDRK